MAFKLATPSDVIGWNTFGSNSFTQSTFGQNTQRNPGWKIGSSSESKIKKKSKLSLKKKSKKRSYKK